MSRFEIVIEDEDREDPVNEGAPWTAALFPIFEDGESGELLASGSGATPHDAVMDLLSDADTLRSDTQ